MNHYENRRNILINEWYCPLDIVDEYLALSMYQTILNRFDDSFNYMYPTIMLPIFNDEETTILYKTNLLRKQSLKYNIKLNNFRENPFLMKVLEKPFISQFLNEEYEKLLFANASRDYGISNNIPAAALPQV